MHASYKHPILALSDLHVIVLRLQKVLQTNTPINDDCSRKCASFLYNGNTWSPLPKHDEKDFDRSSVCRGGHDPR